MLVCFIWMLFNIWSKMGPPSTHCPGLFQMSLHFRAILPKSLLEIGFVSKYGYGIFYFHFIFMLSIFTEKRETLIFVQMSVRVLFFFYFNYPLGLYKMKLEELPLIYPLRSFWFWFILYNQKALSAFIQTTCPEKAVYMQDERKNRALTFPCMFILFCFIFSITVLSITYLKVHGLRQCFIIFWNLCSAVWVVFC